MKKLLSVLAAFVLVFTLAACGGNRGFELALVTDIGTIDDRSFNQGAWEGLEQYAKENDITHKFYQPSSQSHTDYLNTISLAVEGGAKLVVMPGFLFETAAYEAQTKFPDVKFILLDGVPRNEDFTDFKTADNLVSIVYQEEVAGFMAGYATVKDGFKNLGFMGGLAVPAVQRFGIGFIQGAEAAAKEMNLTDVTIRYNYVGGFLPTPEIQAQAASWYNDGIEVIFASAGGAGSSVIAAAERTENGLVVGVDVDQHFLSTQNRILTSAVKGLTVSVYDAIAEFYAGDFRGGQNLNLGLDTDGVGIALDNANFRTYSEADNDKLEADILAGKYTISNDIEKDAESFGSTVKVTEIR